MTEVRRHQRITETGRRTTVRHHTRSAPGTGEAAREAWEERAAGRYTPPPAAVDVTAEPAGDGEPWWDTEDNPQPQPWTDDDERYQQRAAYLQAHPNVTGLLADEAADRDAAAADDVAQRMIAERLGDSEQWDG